MGQEERRLREGTGGGNCDQTGEKLRHLLSEAIPIWKCYCKAHASRGFDWKGLRASHLQLWTSCGLCKPRMSQGQKKRDMFCLYFIFAQVILPRLPLFLPVVYFYYSITIVILNIE